MSSDRFLAILALVGLAAFLGVYVVWVPALDMTFFILVTLALAAYDFLAGFRKKRGGG